MSATDTRFTPPTEMYDLGYSAIYTHDDWPTLRDTVGAERPLTADDWAELRRGWEDAQIDYASYQADMADMEAAREREQAAIAAREEVCEFDDSMIPY